jgi:pimeloyl-ACP methyl ester carboxylesterase
MKLHYRHFGHAGPPVIILHGLFGSGDNWMMHGKELAQAGFRVFMPDQRNHGRSPWSESHSYHDLAADAISFADHHFPGEPVHFVGHSMGGKTVMTAALLYPEKIASLTVVDIAPRPYGLHHHPIIEAMRSLPAGLQNRAEVDSHLARAVPEESTRQFLMKSLEKDEQGQFRWRINLDVLQASLPVISGPLFSDESVHIHTLFIRGEKSEYIRDKDLFEIKKQFPYSAIVTIPDAGHWVQAEQPVIFLETLKDWLT